MKLHNMVRSLLVCAVFLLGQNLSTNDAHAGSIPIFSGSVNLSASQLNDYSLTVNGNITSGGTLVWPNGVKGLWNVTNSANATITLQYASQTAAGVQIAAGATQQVYGNGITLFAQAALPSSGALTPTQIAVMQNNITALLPHTMAGISAVRANIRNSRWLFVSDSVGAGAGNNLTNPDKRTNSYPGYMSRKLMAAGINSHFNSFMGAGAGDNAAYDGRIGVTGSWNEGVSQFVGGQFYYNPQLSGTLSFSPTVPVDTFNYFAVTNGGVQALDIDGGSATLYNTTGALGLGTRQLTTTLGIHTANINWSSGNTIYVQGIEAYDSSKKWVSIINAGWPTSTSQYWAQLTTAVNLQAFCNLLTPDVVFIDLNRNDWTQAVPIATYTANIQTLITQAKAGGADVVLLTGNPSSAGTAPIATQQLYVNALYSLASTNNVLLIDTWNAFFSGNEATAATLGLMFDGVHPNEAGSDFFNTAMLNFMGALTRGTNPPLSVSQIGAILKGTTTGQITYYQPVQQPGFKVFSGNASGYENTTGTAQTITFNPPFIATPTISVNDTGLTLTATTTTLTITGSEVATHTGNIQVTGP